jgi:hypothetical protein
MEKKNGQTARENGTRKEKEKILSRREKLL